MIEKYFKKIKKNIFFVDKLYIVLYCLKYIFLVVYIVLKVVDNEMSFM